MAEYNPYQAPTAEVDHAPAPPGEGDTLHPPASTLARGVVVGLIACAVFDLVWVWADSLQIQLLRRFQAGDIDVAAANANDERIGMVAIGAFALLLATAIPFAMWLVRANKTARSIDPGPIDITPGWTVGWFFVPVANLWKPYQAVKQIWDASASGDPRLANSSPAVFPLWWTAWIVGSISGTISAQMMSGTDLDRLVLATQIDLFSEVVSMVAAVAAAAMILLVTRTQERVWQARARG